MTHWPRLILLSATAIALVAERGAHACSVCLRIDDSATVAGVQAGLVVLLSVTGGVLGGFAAFIVRFVGRERRADDSDVDGRS